MIIVETMKEISAARFPGPYMWARGLKNHLYETWEDRRNFPYTSYKSLGDISYLMRVCNRREQWVVDGLCFEEEMLIRMMNCIKEGDVIYDVGAATGTHTIPAALKTSPAGLVYAFEPDRDCAQGLKENLALNNISNAIVLKTALWNKDVTLTLHTSGRGGAPAQVGEVTSVNGFKNHQLIQARSIESLVRSDQVRYPDIIKIDVEGAGLHVLQGLGEARPRHIFMEVHPLLGESKNEVVEFLVSRGYQIMWESPRQGELHLHFVKLA